MTGKVVPISGSGAVSGIPNYVLGFTLTPAAADSTLILKDGGSSGTEKLDAIAKANTNTVVVLFPAPVRFDTDIYAAITGSGAKAKVIIPE